VRFQNGWSTARPRDPKRYVLGVVPLTEPASAKHTYARLTCELLTSVLLM